MQRSLLRRTTFVALAAAAALSVTACEHGKGSSSGGTSGGSVSGGTSGGTNGGGNVTTEPHDVLHVTMQTGTNCYAATSPSVLIAVKGLTPGGPYTLQFHFPSQTTDEKVVLAKPGTASEHGTATYSFSCAKWTRGSYRVTVDDLGSSQTTQTFFDVLRQDKHTRKRSKG